MLLITGATGHLGKATVQSLLDKGIGSNEIAALARDPGKAVEWKNKGLEIRAGDYTDYNSMRAGLKGIDKLLLISSSEVAGDRFLQHKNAIDAAKENGIKHIIYTGIDIKSFADTAIPFVSQVHIDTANYLKESGISYTLLNNTLYADLIPLLLGENVMENGIFFPAGNGKTPFTLRADMAAAAAAVLTTGGHENKEYAIASDTAYSFADFAAMLSQITGREVTYLNTDKQTYIEQTVQAGVPEQQAAFLAGFGEAISRGEFDTHRSDLEKLLGRKPVDVKTFLQSVYAK